MHLDRLAVEAVSWATADWTPARSRNPFARNDVTGAMMS
jgi:hypothetical protein